MSGRLQQLISHYTADPRVWFRNWRWRATNRVSNVRLLLVLGAPRSGTTLLQKVLEAHSQCFSINRETGAFTRSNLFLDGRPHFDLPPEQVKELIKSSSDVVDFFERGVSIVRDQLGADESMFFVKKTPHHILALPFILRAFPNAHIVHVTRDGRDCLRSAWSNKNVPQQSSTVRFAKFWAKCVNAGLNEEPNPRVHRIGYEAFTTRPTDELHRIMQGIGLEPEDQQLDPEKRTGDQRAGQDAFARLGSAISPATVGAWRKALDSKQKTDFVRIASDTLERLGYPRQ